MSVEEVTMYRVKCDQCGKATADSTFYAWADADQALEVATESTWLVNDDGQWCPNCQFYTVERDEYIGGDPKAAVGA